MYKATWKVYGATGHRQRVSFGPSCFLELSSGGNVRQLSILNSDITGTNDYSIVSITRNTEQECESEFFGQLDDGIFENSRYGKIERLH